VLLFLFETLVTMDHLILFLFILALKISGEMATQAYTLPIMVAVTSVLLTATLNLVSDARLREAAEKVNLKPVEKLMLSKRHKSFQLSDWGSI
jgi:hypothetical protein